jgi:O-methyltransferase
MALAQLLNDLLERASGRRLIRPSTLTEGAVIGVLDQVAGRTMAFELQQYTTWSAVRYLVQNRIAGAIVECGSWRGGQGMIAALTLMHAGDTSRDIYLFDTFEGMTAPTDEDISLEDGTHARQLLDAHSSGDRTHNAWSVADQDDVWNGMASTGYPPERMHLVAGRVEDTLPSGAPAAIALLRLDTDWYESTRHELVHLWDRVVPNGIVVIDDYDFWSGSRQAVDEFFAARNQWPMLFRPGNGRALVKTVDSLVSGSGSRDHEVVAPTPVA